MTQWGSTRQTHTEREKNQTVFVSNNNNYNNIYNNSNNDSILYFDALILVYLLKRIYIYLFIDNEK